MILLCSPVKLDTAYHAYKDSDSCNYDTKPKDIDEWKFVSFQGNIIHQQV